MSEMSMLAAYKCAAEIIELLDGWREKDSWESEWDSKEDMTQHVADIVIRRANGFHPDDDSRFLKCLDCGVALPASVPDGGVEALLAVERERCAKAVEQSQDAYKGSKNIDYDYGISDGMDRAATAIRSLTPATGEEK